MTRRSIKSLGLTEKNLVDIGPDKSVSYSHGSSKPDKADKAGTEGIKINDGVWDEMITVGKLLCLIKDDPDIYDLFDWMRINIYGGQVYGEGLLSRVDSEIAKELGPWTRD